MDDDRSPDESANGKVRPLFPAGAAGVPDAGGSDATSVPAPSPLDQKLAGYYSQLGNVRQNLQTTASQLQALQQMEQQLVGAISALEDLKKEEPK